jgi:hypothetical protein
MKPRADPACSMFNTAMIGLRTYCPSNGIATSGRGNQIAFSQHRAGLNVKDPSDRAQLISVIFL